ncbi:hypothetical protein SeMB42_g01662 [Synchytrium endobioticum]|uniref:ubiquitinyl hydrolase 1 n=1 Tax=Synchytrium endobioticum TaxID=286115 RepID=A0A507D966_9FUNG|nr:hypothetical protein SeLEV6574_g02229 [Synchytrium endobioticum]TPX52076.1 hypothetical protein SeMB42_g01662 [Synchytrium endobioticum]
MADRTPPQPQIQEDGAAPCVAITAPDGCSSPKTFEETRPSDDEILRFEKEAKAEELNKPVVSDITDFSALSMEYANGAAIFKSKIHSLATTCRGVRAIKKDGNCFYRAFGFRLAELLAEHDGSLWSDSVLARVVASKDMLVEQGYDLGAIQDFYDISLRLLMPSRDSKSLMHRFVHESYDADTLVCYLRLVTAALLKRDREIYEAFVADSYPTIDLFISHQVEPMQIEADNIHIVAISNALGVNVKVANLDTSETDGEVINYHEFTHMDSIQGVKNEPEVHLLYRPGHYDILYPNIHHVV